VSSLRARKRRRVIAESLTIEAAAPQVEVDRDETVRQALLASISKLRPRMVEILILHYEHNYSDREIATMLNTSRGVIAVTLYRARARLRKLMLRELAGGKE
jgi:RNA polymerase sigma factor (sigma-70 family)